MTYEQAIQFLCRLGMFGAKPGLEATFKLAALAGNPQKELRFIHVAGTNGKGSTCAMLESIYRAGGFRVGLFTSPHLVSFSERIQVNRQSISQGAVVRLLSEAQLWLKAFSVEAHPTFFEIVTVMALRYFVEQKCELVIWETGLGGRLDATNIVSPLASVITSLSLDHETWLGDTIGKIASEKAGIIKPGLPVITSATPGQGLEEIRAAARERESALMVVSGKDTTQPPLNALTLPLLGEFQRINAALAVATARTLREALPVSEETIVRGLSQVSWLGRMQLVQRPSGPRILLDGAHNPAGAQVLRSEIQKHFPETKPTLILGILKDKDWRKMSALLAPLAGRLVLTPLNSERTLAAAELLPACREANAKAPIVLCSSLAEALASVEKDPLVIITGSLYLVGEAMELLGLSPALAQDERGLNEWGPPQASA